MKTQEIIFNYLSLTKTYGDIVTIKTIDNLRDTISLVGEVFAITNTESCDLVREWLNNNGLHESSDDGRELWFKYATDNWYADYVNHYEEMRMAISSIMAIPLPLHT